MTSAELARPLVSVVIPVRNGQDFLEEAVASALAQTYGNLEHIVVDDGSDDSSADLIRDRFGAQVSVLRTSARGVSAARNAGVRASRGSYVAFLDADDVWLPDKVDRQVERFRAKPELGACYGAAQVVNRALVPVGRLDAPSGARALRQTLLMEHPYAPGPSSAMFRREVLTAVGLFDETLGTSADCELFCRVAVAYEVDGIADPVVLYRCHPRQMHRDPLATGRDMARVIDKMFAYGLPPELRDKRNRAEANLQISIAGAYLKDGRYLPFFRHMARAFLRRPDRVLAAASRVNAVRMWKKATRPPRASDLSPVPTKEQRPE